jgi:hypothetical protein
MIDKKMVIKLRGNEYPMAFNLNVIEAIQDKYGTIVNWQDKITPKNNEVQIKDIKWTLMSFINEGIEIENDENEVKKPLITEKQLGRMITGFEDIQSASQSIMDAVTQNVPETKNL